MTEVVYMVAAAGAVVLAILAGFLLGGLVDRRLDRDVDWPEYPDDQDWVPDDPDDTLPGATGGAP